MRYTCHECASEHGEDNMVAFCAACVGKLKDIVLAQRIKITGTVAYCTACTNKLVASACSKSKIAAMECVVEAARKIVKSMNGPYIPSARTNLEKAIYDLRDVK